MFLALGVRGYLDAMEVMFFTLVSTRNIVPVGMVCTVNLQTSKELNRTTMISTWDEEGTNHWLMNTIYIAR